MSNSLRKVWYNLSPNQRYLVRRLYYLPVDMLDQIRGKRHKYVPPRGKIYTGSPADARNYIQQGKTQVEILKMYAELKPDHRVLDIGSGVGRTAIGLTEFLSASGSYEGFDVVEAGVNWCNNRIKKDHPNFNFKYVPLFNDLYNNSKQLSTEFLFPYTENQFDVVYTFSVFTHMQIDEIDHYFNQIAKVLKADGKCLSTFFLYDDNNEHFISHRNEFNFGVHRDGHKLMSEGAVNGNIAIHEEKLQAMMEKNGLKLEKIEHGFWKDKVRDPNKIECQDIAVFSLK